MASKDNYWNTDRMLMRIKDILIIGSALYGIFIVGAKYYPLPGDVEALASISKDHEKRIEKVENAISDIREIKAVLLSQTKE